jgi:hypothetical protein
MKLAPNFNYDLYPASLLQETNQNVVHPEGITALYKKSKVEALGEFPRCDLGFNTPVTHRAGFELQVAAQNAEGLSASEMRSSSSRS